MTCSWTHQSSVWIQLLRSTTNYHIILLCCVYQTCISIHFTAASMGVMLDWSGWLGSLNPRMVSRWTSFILKLNYLICITWYSGGTVSPQVCSLQNPTSPKFLPPPKIIGTNSTSGSDGKQWDLASPYKSRNMRKCIVFVIVFVAHLRSDPITVETPPLVVIFCLWNWKVIVPPTKHDIILSFTFGWCDDVIPDGGERIKIIGKVSWPTWNYNSLD